MEKENSNKSFSSVLIEAMRAKGIDASKLADETGISERFIKLLIKNNFEKLPPTPYLRGYILKIANVIDMNGEKVWEEYFKNSGRLKSSGDKDYFPKNRFSVSKLNKKFLAIFIIIIIIIAYFIIRTSLGINVSRELTLKGFKEDPVVSEEAFYKIEGNINFPYQLEINQQFIYSESNGDFSKIIELDPGFNTVVFKIKGTLKREEKVTKEIYYETDVLGQATTTIITTSSIIND